MDTSMKKLPPKPVDQKKRAMHWALAILTVLLIVWSCTGIDFGGIKQTAGQIAGAIFSGIFHPDWSYVYNGTGEDLVSQLWDTVCIAFLGTFISAIISLPFAFWAAHTRHKKWYVSRVGKIVLAIIRSFPEIVLALMFIKAVGPGSAAGVLALGFHSVGMLAKLFSEAIENLEDGPNEAVTAAGGSKTNVVMFSILPNLLPALISNTLYRFDVSIRSASVLGLVGAGKSTLLRSINRLIDITEGDILINGESITKAKGKELRMLRRNIGMIFQSFNLVKRSSVLRNVLTGRVGYYPTWKSTLNLFTKEDKQRAYDALQQVDLADKVYTRADELSGGQQQRVAIARVLTQDPDIILADEPTASLDPQTSRRVMQDLKMLNEKHGMTVVINLHSVELAQEFGKRVIGVRAGEIIYDGKMSETPKETFDQIYSGGDQDE